MVFSLRNLALDFKKLILKLFALALELSFQAGHLLQQILGLGVIVLFLINLFFQLIDLLPPLDSVALIFLSFLS